MIEKSEKTLEQLKAENDQMVKDICKRIDECNQAIKDINKGLSSLRVMACAVDKFCAERSNH